MSNYLNRMGDAVAPIRRIASIKTGIIRDRGERGAGQSSEKSSSTKTSVRDLIYGVGKDMMKSVYFGAEYPTYPIYIITKAG